MKLHIGGKEIKEGWTLLNIQPSPGVDIVGNCTDLSMIPDGTVDEAYGAHVLEHLDYAKELPQALSEVRRVLKPGGLFGISVPDLGILGPLMGDPSLTVDDHYLIMRMIFGGQSDADDFHKVGLTEDILTELLARAGFSAAQRVTTHGLFNDGSVETFHGQLISLNMVAKS